MSRVNRSKLWWTLTLLLVLMVLPERASAHPLGNFTVNQYSRVEVGTDRAIVRYIVDMAEIPTYQEFGGTLPDQAGQTAFLDRKAAELRQGLTLVVDGRPRVLEPIEQQLTFPAGQGGLATTRIALTLTAALDHVAAGTRRDISFTNANYAERQGWREIVIPASNGQVIETDAATADQSDELRSYPEDMLSSPLDLRAAHAVVAVAAGPAAPALNGAASPTARTPDRFAALITAEQIGPGFLVLALLAAVGLGAVHALSPGHGKTIVGAYLVGARGTARQAVFLGLTVTITHTLGVFALGLITLYASRYILPEQLYPWLGVLSGVMVVVMGVSLLWRRLRPRRHSADGHTHADGDDHVHGPTTHTHLPPAGAALSWSSLLAMGISGGLIPCPSALIVMLSAISLHRVGLGLVLIVAFSLGLAGVLTGIGLLFVYGGRWVGLLGRGRGRSLHQLVRIVPIGSAMFVTVAGVVITAQAALQAGWFR